MELTSREALRLAHLPLAGRRRDCHHWTAGMNRHSYPLRERAKLAAWRGFNNAVDWARTPIRRSRILLVTGDADQAKSTEVESRLRFLFEYLGVVPEFRTVRNASLLSYLRYQAVAAVDATAVPVRIRRNVRWVADLDYEANPNDGWALMELGTALSRRELKSPIATGRHAFIERVRGIKAAGPRPVYLFGTGPSLESAGTRSFSDGTTVVCNTIVRDPELWHHLKPSFFTASDAIYHFGHNAHARAFRADALRRLQESAGRTLFVYPAVFDVVVRSEFQDVKDSLVPIPWGEHDDVTVDLANLFMLPHVGNVLNAMLLPIGCTLSTDIRLWGFDGRAPTDSGFWSNSSRHAYPELMQNIREAHPAFFADLVPAGNENQYVRVVHGDLLDERLRDAEGRGFQFQMLHPSWTPTLNKRHRGEGL